MASFYAELHLEGHVYVVVRCRFVTHQSTGQRGRTDAKVRLGPLELELERDADDYLTLWAATAYAPKSGYVVFFDTGAKSARETIAFTGGHVVGLHEFFGPNHAGETAYRCTLTLTADKFELLPGAPANLAFIRPAAGSHGTPQAALLGVAPDVAETIRQTVEPFVLPALPDILTTAGIVLAPYVVPVLSGAAEVLLLIVASTTPAHAPGRPAPALDRDALRLRELAAKHAAGTLTPDEADEYVALLAKVKGIRLTSTNDLNVVGKYKKKPQGLPGFHFEDLTYTKRSQADTDALRRKFDSSIRAKYVKKISTDPAYVAELRAAGFDDDAMALMQIGRVPDGWQVHHQLPLDDGGDNSFGNLLLIKQTPYHSVITSYQKTNTGQLEPGESKQLPCPHYKGGIVYPPKKP